MARQSISMSIGSSTDSSPAPSVDWLLLLSNAIGVLGRVSSIGVPVPSSAPVRYKLSTPFKRYWQGDLWTRLFDVLLNPTLVRPDGKLPVTDELAALREEMEAWLQANCNRAGNSLKGLMKKIDLAVLGGKDAR